MVGQVGIQKLMIYKLFQLCDLGASSKCTEPMKKTSDNNMLKNIKIFT